MITDWDDAYEHSAYVDNAEAFLPMWESKSAAFRADNPPTQIRYGDHPRQLIDLFQPANPKGLVVFIHGGYWHSMNRPTWSHLAAGAMANGWAVAVPGYVLCPEVSIANITVQIAKAIETVADIVGGPINITGHSAGGHLASRMGCDDVTLKSANRIKNIVSISGVHDLRPIIRTAMNDDFKLTTKTAAAESPVFKTPRKSINFIAWVGSEERPEFLRQNQLIANIWAGCEIQTRAFEDNGHNHFTVLAGLEKPDSLLTKALIDVNQRI